MEPSYKKAKYLSAESAPIFLCIDLSFFSLQQLNFLAKQVEEQIRRYTTLQLKDQEETATAQQKNVDTTNDEWIDIGNWSKDDIESEINILNVWSQRGNQYPPSFSKDDFPSSDRRRCTPSALSTFPFLRYSVSKDVCKTL